MSSLRCLSGGGALLALLALWAGCGGVADPGPLTGYDDGDGGSSTSGGSAGARSDDPEPIANGGNGPSDNGGSAGSEGVDPELGIDGNGGRAGAAGDGGAGGTAPVGSGGAQPTGMGGNEPGTGGTESGNGGTDPGAGGTESGSGGSFDPGTGGTESGSGGTFDPGTGGTESGSGGSFDPGTGGTEAGSGGTESATGGTGGDENGRAGGAGGSDEPPPIVDVEVGQCDAFEACGGDVEGVWTYTAACVDLDDLGLSEEAIEDMCPGAQLTLSGQVSGTLTFEDGVVTRQGQSRAEGEVFVPGLCAIALGGCGGVEDDLAEAGLVGAVCVAQGSPFLPSCRCSFEIDAPEIEAVPFDTVGSVIRLDDGRDFAYCAVGDSLSYEEIGAATEPGVRELTRR